ncbi:MAG: TolC family protein [Aureliella sp.]
MSRVAKTALLLASLVGCRSADSPSRSTFAELASSRTAGALVDDRAARPVSGAATSEVPADRAAAVESPTPESSASVALAPIVPAAFQRPPDTAKKKDTESGAEPLFRPSPEALPRGELQPGVGERFLPPPEVPPTPTDLPTAEALTNQAAAQPLLGLEALEQMACQNNPTLVQARAQIQGTLGMAIQAGLWPNPRLFYRQEQIGLEGTPGEFLGGVVQQEIPTGNKLQLSRAKFLTRTRVSEWIAMEQQYQVLNDVRVHYFHTLGMQEIVRLQRELLKNAEDHLLTVREMVNVGQATQAEAHMANVALQQQRLQLLDAENMLRESWQTLTATVGAELPFAALQGRLDDRLPMIEWDPALARLMDESPQLMQARTKLDGDRITVQRELVQPVPNVFVQTGAGQNFEAKQGVGLAQVFVDAPVWDWNQGTIRQARADYTRQDAEIRRVELTLRQKLATEYRQYITAYQRAENFEKVILPESRSAYEIRLDSYEDDRLRWTDVLASENAYLLLQIDYINSLVQLRESEVLIIGYLLHGGLMTPERPTPPGHIDATPRPR